MTPRERLLAVLNGKIPDRVPVAPDFSNMIPCRLTGKPFWQIYLYNDPPLHEAYVNCARHFNIDSLWDGFYMHFAEDDDPNARPVRNHIVHRAGDMLVTQKAYIDKKELEWLPVVDVYYRADSPSGGISPAKIGLPAIPARYEPVEGVKPVDCNPQEHSRIKKLMGDQGLVGVNLANTNPLRTADDVYNYFDNPDKHEQWAQERVAAVERRFKRMMELDDKPDFFCVGGSGTLIFQTMEIFRQLAFPAV